MGLFIADTDGVNTFRLAQCELDLIQIAAQDAGQGSTAGANVEGVTCNTAIYNGSTAGVTQIRLNDLTNNVTYVSPPNVVIMAVTQDFVLSDGSQLGFGGVSIPVGNALNPFAAQVCTIYDQELCGGAGVTVEAQGGGTAQTSSSVILYHELSHCFHFVTGTTGGASEERNATIDENDQRAVEGLGLRDIDSRVANCGGGGGGCCIVATLATESPFSTEVHRFRKLREHVLRKSEVGDNFFKNFFYHYYGFSPEITRLMGSQPEFSPLVKERFVLPLLAGVELLIHYADHKGKGLANFLQKQAERGDLAYLHSIAFLQEIKTYLAISKVYDEKMIDAVLSSKGKEFLPVKKALKYINRKTLENEFIRWPLIELMELWAESAFLLHSGKNERQIDKDIYRMLSEWMGKMPVTTIWEEFSGLQVKEELDYLEQFIFDRRSKEIFATRLSNKHSGHAHVVRTWARRKVREV